MTTHDYLFYFFYFFYYPSQSGLHVVLRLRDQCQRRGSDAVRKLLWTVVGDLIMRV